VNWLDYLLLAIVAISAAMGLHRGVIRMGFSLIATIAALEAGLWFYGAAAAPLQEYVSHRMVANLIGFLLVFLAAQAGGALLGYLLAKFFKAAGLSWLDRLLGGGLGLVRGAVVAAVLVMTIMAFSHKPPPKAIVDSHVAPYVVEASSAIVAMAPREVKDGFHQSYREAKRLWKWFLDTGIKELPELKRQTI
jgi:membrane protein required for colicin V production